jgi:hypothetical protein
MPHPSVEATLSILHQLAPSTTFLALGQTVFWDEPVKAVWRRLLDRHWPSAQLVAGIHDTDYFAKTTAHVRDDQQFIALAHDDGATRGLWSAAGELSALLGSEDLPTRSEFEALGIPFDQLAGRDSAERRSFFAEFTNAYGWRGVVQTSGTAQISHDVPLSEFGPALLELLSWGFKHSVASLSTNNRIQGEKVAETICCWVSEYLERCPDESTLTDLYEHLLPKFYELLLDFEPTNFDVTSTAQLLKFNSSTAHLPRFAFVQIYLDPSTAPVAKRAYSAAVAGGGMYALDHFGEGALPFDVVVPGRGRGTLHVLDTSIQIDFAPLPITLSTDSQVTSIAQLAALLSSEFGEDVVLVGKAVSLISMLSAEFTLIFHETASGYTDRTASMNDSLRAQGVQLPDLSPILRLQYKTWDSLSEVDGPFFNLPEHLASAYKTNGESISAAEFGHRWRDVVEQQKGVLRDLSNTRRLRDLTAYLEHCDSAEQWRSQRMQFENAIRSIRENYENGAPVRNNLQDLREKLQLTKNERQRLETASGKDFRTRMLPLMEQLMNGRSESQSEIARIKSDRNTQFTVPIAHLAHQARELKRAIKRMSAAKRQAERSDQVLSSIELIKKISKEANLAKLSIARSAYLTIHGMPHMDSRPSSWWFPMVDPTGTWFDNLTETVEARLEPV